jgi:hypothetical protein
VEQEVAWLEREVNPTAPQANAPMTGAKQEIASQQSADAFKDLRIASRMQSVAAVIHPQAIKIKTARIPPHDIALLEDGDVRDSFARELIRSPGTRGAGSEDQQSGTKPCPNLRMDFHRLELRVLLPDVHGF